MGEKLGTLKAPCAQRKLLKSLREGYTHRDRTLTLNHQSPSPSPSPIYPLAHAAMGWSDDVHKSQSLPSRYRAAQKLRRAGAPVQRPPNASGLLPIVAVASASGALVWWRKENRKLQRRQSIENIPVLGGLLAGLRRGLEGALRRGGRAAAPARQSASADAWRQQRPADMAALAAAERSQVRAQAFPLCACELSWEDRPRSWLALTLGSFLATGCGALAAPAGRRLQEEGRRRQEEEGQEVTVPLSFVSSHFAQLELPQAYMQLTP